MADITMPQLGETVTEGTIIRWFKQVGDTVELDEPVFEVSTDKVDSEIPSPVSGVLSEILANEGDVVEVGQVLARVGDIGDTPTEPPQDDAADDADDDDAGNDPVDITDETTDEPATGDNSDDNSDDNADSDGSDADDTTTHEIDDEISALVSSPIVRKLILDNNLNAADIAGTGVGGRITRADVEKAMKEDKSAGSKSKKGTKTDKKRKTPANTAPTDTPPTKSTGTESGVFALNNIRRRTAEHMVMSKQVSPHVLTAIEVDYENVERVRTAQKAAWKEAEGFSLTYLPFISRATIDALKEFPHLNASFDDNEIFVHEVVNLAIAVDLEFNGLLAPVIHEADTKSLRDLAREVVDLAGRARSRKLKPDELSLGTFTITNPGQYGTMMQFPIINQPQVAILSTDGISRKPVVVTDDHGTESIAIHSVGVLALAWDHRAIDGAYAAAFLQRTKQILETRDWASEIN